MPKISTTFSASAAAFAFVLSLGICGGAVAQNVLTYHNTPDRSGLYITPKLNWDNAAKVHMDPKFDGTITGNVYAQPLYWIPPTGGDGMIIVATESNTVYALDAETGAEIWQRSLGHETPRSALCAGNIDPVGVTGAPVIDPDGKVLYLDGLIDTASGPRHKVFALSLDDGKILDGWPVDVGKGVAASGETFDSTAQGQRGALAFIGGELYVPFAGIDGDCGNYHGIVAGITVGSAPKLAHLWSTRAPAGGVWGQGSIAFDGDAMFFTTGNTFTSPSSAWGDGEAVIRVGPTLAHSHNTAHFFTPTNWQQLDAEDADLGGTAALPVDVPKQGSDPLPRIIQFGKDANAYLLDRTNLGGIGGQLAVAQVSTGRIITGPATFPRKNAAMIVFQGNGSNCPSGQSGNLVALRLTQSAPTTIETRWCASFDGAGAPMVTTTDGTANPIVWVVGAEGDNRLYGFRGTDGEILFQGSDAMNGLHHFQTLIAANNRLYIAGDGKVYSFKY